MQGEPKTAGQRAPRTAPELAALLLALLRVVKARRLLEPGDAKLSGVFQLSYRSWQSDLERRGPLVLEVSELGFREANAKGLLAHAQLETLQHGLLSRGVCALEVDADLDADGFAGFVEVLATNPSDPDPRAFAAALAASVPVGVRVKSGNTPPAPGERAVDDSDVAEQPDVEKNETAWLLRELDAASSISSYLDLARRAAATVERRADSGEGEDYYRIVETFARHAEGKDDDRIREVAHEYLTGLLVGRRRDELIAHITSGDALSVRSGQLLLMLGDEATPALLDALAKLGDRQQRDRLETMLVALGERILPELLRRMDLDSVSEMRTAVRLAGETQHPASVHRLGDLLEHADRGLREEAVRALVRIGNDDAIAALARAVRSAQKGIPMLAIAGLGNTGSARAVPPLKSALEHAVEERNGELAKELIRALGRLGRAEASASLVAVLQRKVRIGMGWLKELQAAAVTALGAVPGDEAVGALAQAAQSKDAALRRAAQSALDRRAESLAKLVSRPVR